MNIEWECALLGCVTFAFLHGIAVVDPTFISWLMQRDSATHFMGWHFFRFEPWSFPIGIIKSYVYPQGTSIVFTDSIPLMALPLKLFSPVLSQSFQYLGLWVLLSYILQGYFGAKLMRQVTNNQAFIFIGTLFFLLSPVMQRRAFNHTALVSHWVILAALYLYFCDENRAKLYNWTILLVSASLIHFYLLFMAGVIWGAYLCRLKCCSTTAIKMITITIGITALTMWATGYFVVGVSATSVPGYGERSMMNLLAPIIPPFNNSFAFNPVKFLPPISSALLGQKEGFNYLGLGTLGLVTFALYQYLINPLDLKLSRHRPLVFVAFFLTLLAVSNKVTFYDSVLFEVSIPVFVKQTLGIMHAGGRMFWPVAYLLILISFAIIERANKSSSPTAFFILIMLIIIQAIDVWPGHEYRSRGSVQFDNPLRSKEWGEIVSKISHIEIVPPERNGDDYLPFALLAANNGKTINVGRVARTAPEQIHAATIDYLGFKEGKLRMDTLYVIREENPSKPIDSDKFNSKILDGYHIICPREK